MSEERREKIEVIVQLFFGLGVVANVLWYFMLEDWQLAYVLFYFIPLVATIMSFVFFISDTPICLVMRNDARYALR